MVAGAEEGVTLPEGTLAATQLCPEPILTAVACAPTCVPAVHACGAVFIFGLPVQFAMSAVVTFVVEQVPPAGEPHSQEHVRVSSRPSPASGFE